MNFFINRAMGIGNSGVEHAQFYRGKLFDKAGLPYRYVFVELVRELHEAMDAWNLSNDQVINMWEYFVYGDEYLDHGPLYKQAVSSEMVIDGTNTNRMFTTQTSSGLTIIEHMVKFPDPKKTNMLLVSTSRVEIFNAETGKRMIMFEYDNEPHREYLIKNVHLFDFKGKHLYFENEVALQKFFFEQLNAFYEGKNTFIIDRGEESEVALYKMCDLGTKIVELVHADHLSDRDDPKHPLWNNYYEYMLMNMDKVDRVIVATKLQRDDLLVDFPADTDKIVAIPVGGIRDKKPKAKIQKKKNGIFKFVSVSRLAEEKHIDLCVRAIAKLHDAGHKVSLDIYGQGETKKKIEDVIAELSADSYIKLKGHSNHVDEVYPQYDAFISGSFSEGFGLTYIEALSASLPILSFNARFGALELIQDGENGFLAKFKRDDDNYSVDELAAAGERMLATNYTSLVRNARRSVSEYKDSVLAKKWGALIDEL
ncbi:glycosyltransferase [Periweissella fabaria]|uniref:UDP-N-acetylglucosamine--peptide N-acetylglucosaminyltransferase GtfA subunit n=1 Tax=Periweissella fabaria TaxID=546157 RepID=A0ABN8BI52_9LACO|nr:glycosyltransferase [Periweissella fabaria]MCM0597201.1 glycosyltransferase [Periweissella fabaria]CAH0416294.1 UDP-N-acetylglucosamine--peptide N-acetylglucosaminyltransferase GtfA subunit [Periweissella fabaria]